jgi:tetratricopeptide (TPR) repeat protein
MNNMKVYKIFITLSVIIAMTCITSCEDSLEKLPLNNLSVDSYFTSDGDFKLYTDGFYPAFTDQPGAWTSSGTNNSILLDFRSDLVSTWPAKSGNRSLAELDNGTMMPSSGAASLFWNWSAIRSAYILFDNIDRVELNAENKNLYMGTAYYLLANRYFMMFRAYESVPIVRKVLDVSEADVPSSPKEEVFAEALNHINKAIELLPSLGPGERERGRLTRLVAMTLKAELLLYTAGYYREAMPGAKFSDAATAAQAAIAEAKNKGYGLCSDYNSLFIADEQAGVEPQKEIIYEWVRLKEVATADFGYWQFGPHQADAGGWGDFSLSQECVDMFECTDGLPVGKSSLYNSEKPFENRDPRFGLTTIYPGRICTFQDGSQWVANTLSEFVYDNDGNQTDVANIDYLKSTLVQIDRSPSGYINIKYWDRYKSNLPRGHTSFINYRYGGLLLMYAEALNEAGGSLDDVRNVLTEIRARVGMPAVTATTHPTAEALRTLIRNERVVELICEGGRYWDLKRWHLLEERLHNRSHYSMHIAKTFNPDGTAATYMEKLTLPISLDGTKTAEFEIPNGANGGEFITTSYFPGGKFWVWPIPESAINASTTKALKQNPLWE